MIGRETKLVPGTPLARLAVCAAVLFGNGLLFAGPADDYAALEMQMEIAAEEYYEAMEQPGNVDPQDKRREVLARMDKLVQATTGKPDAASIAVGTFVWALDIDTGSGFDRFQKLAREHKYAPELADSFEILPYVYEASSKANDWINVLDKVASSSKESVVKAGAGFVSGQIQLNEKHLEKAKAAFETVRKVAPESIYATNAKGYIFEIEHLQVGMVAPDFKINTLEGKETTLESFRGKAVLLNFWASW